MNLSEMDAEFHRWYDRASWEDREEYLEGLAQAAKSIADTIDKQILNDLLDA